MLSRFHLIPEHYGQTNRWTDLLHQYCASVSWRVIKATNINVKKLPWKFDILVRVEMTSKTAKITLLKQKYHKHDLTVCSAWHFSIWLICKVVLCFFYLNKVIFAVLDVISTLTKMSNFYGSFFTLIVNIIIIRWTDGWADMILQQHSPCYAQHRAIKMFQY